MIALARKQVPIAEKPLVESKRVLTRKLRKIISDLADSAIKSIVSQNASRIDELSTTELSDLRRELDQQKPKAIEQAFHAFVSSPDWMWYPPGLRALPTDPIGNLGINQEGPLWKLLEDYATPLKEVFLKYGLTEGHSAFKTRYDFFHWADSDMKRANRELGEAHHNYCRARYSVESLEREVREAKALEKFESA